MFTLDDRIRGIPALRDQVVSLYQSINLPHLAIPGKKAGPAQAFILSIRAASGFAVFVYLYVAESNDCAVYVSEHRNVSSEQLANEEADALAFVESMGFMVDNLNFRQLPPDTQAEMLRTMPVFQKAPRATAGNTAVTASKAEPTNDKGALGKLFASF